MRGTCPKLGSWTSEGVSSPKALSLRLGFPEVKGVTKVQMQDKGLRLRAKCTTASQPQSLAIFCNRRRNRKEFPQREANLAIFHRKMHRNRNRIVTARDITTHFPERIAAYSLTA